MPGTPPLRSDWRPPDEPTREHARLGAAAAPPMSRLESMRALAPPPPPDAPVPRQEARSCDLGTAAAPLVPPGPPCDTPGARGASAAPCGRRADSRAGSSCRASPPAARSGRRACSATPCGTHATHTRLTCDSHATDRHGDSHATHMRHTTHVRHTWRLTWRLTCASTCDSHATHMRHTFDSHEKSS